MNCPIFDNGASLGFDVIDRLDDYDNIIKYCEFTSPKFFGNRFEEIIELFGYGFRLYEKSIYDFIDLNYNSLGNMAEVFYYQLNKYKQILIN